MVGHSNLGHGRRPAQGRGGRPAHLRRHPPRGRGRVRRRRATPSSPASPAACFSIAGPGATNLLTGLWDAKVDRVPILALTGQVQTQVIGPGTFQEVPLDQAFAPVAEWSQTVLSPANATELAALAMKHAIVQRDVAHLVLPDEVQELPGVDEPAARPRGRAAGGDRASPRRTPSCARAVELLARAPSGRRSSSATAPAPTATRSWRSPSTSTRR